VRVALPAISSVREQSGTAPLTRNALRFDLSPEERGHEY
jgi:hypothetical protein